MSEQASASNELVISRVLDAPRDKVFRCWKDAALIRQWFAPRPWTTPSCHVELKAGSEFSTVMRSPEGQDFPTSGVFLDVVENERIVFTDAFTPGWKPSGKPFMVAEITLADAGPGKTRYTARAMHWNAEDCAAHEKMGFHEGWSQCADQLGAVAARL